jgi:hypothetical protein
MGGLEPPIQGKLPIIAIVVLDGRIKPGHGEYL